MLSNKNNDKVIEVLRILQLTYLIKPFEKMISLEQNKKITIHKMSWKVIMRDIHDYEHLGRKHIEKTFLSYFLHFGILVQKRVKVDKRVSKERVKRHRELKKELGYRTISILVNSADFERFKRFIDDFNLTYEQAFNRLLNNAYSKR